MTSDMLLELLGQRHRGSAGSYQASIGFSRATFGDSAAARASQPVGSQPL